MVANTKLIGEIKSFANTTKTTTKNEHPADTLRNLSDVKMKP